MVFYRSTIKNYLLSWYNYILSVFLTTNELRITVLGLQNSGKSTFVSLLNGDSFRSDSIPTVGMQYSRFKVDSTLIKCYDLGGQARFEPLWKMYYNNTDLIVYIVDLSDIDRLKESRQRLLNVINDTNETDIPIIIIGNKTDLSKRVFRIETLAQFLGIDYQNNLSVLFMKKNNEAELDFLLNKLKNNDQITAPNTDNYKLSFLNARNGSISSTKFDEFDIKNFTVLERDVGLFLASFKTGDGLIDIIKWIMGRDV